MGKKKNQQTKIESPDQEEQADDDVDKIDISVSRESVPSFQTEEQKVQPLQRKNSKFNLEATASITETKVLYRPEFFHQGKPKDEKIWELMGSYMGSDTRAIQRSIVNHVEYTLARTRFNFDNKGAYQATGFSVRDRLIEAWNDTQQYHTVSHQLTT